MKLLSICVPTYNREKAFKNLYDSFLAKALNIYGDVVEVVVCDNSDADVAAVNRAILHPDIKYFHNEINIRFAGNFIRCLRESTGEFIWIISDDDFVLWDGFVSIMESLPKRENSDIDCYMVPFFSKSPYGDVVFSNRDTDWNLKTGATVSELVSTNQCPFILFSGGVLRVDKSGLSKMPEKYLKNAYIQTVLFLSMLKPDSKIKFLSSPALEYQPGYIGQTIGVAEMAASLVDVRKYTEEQFGTKPDYDSDYRGWLLWLVHHRGGFYYLYKAEHERWLMLASLHKHLSIKAILLAVAILVPRFMIRPVYLVYKTN